MQNAKHRLGNGKRKKPHKAFLTLLCALLLFFVLLLRVWFSSKAVELACEIDRLAEEKETLEEENRRLSLEAARLKSPERISRIAVADLNMIRSLDAEVIMLER